MTYIDGFIIPVPEANKEAYRAMAENAAPIFRKHGATEVGETWGNDLSRGKNTDFFMAVNAKENENVVFSWIVWPSKEARDKGNEAAMAELAPSFAVHKDTFDGKRMFWGRFDLMLENGERSDAAYIDGFIIPVPEENEAAYRKQAEDSAPIFMDLGATRVVECWSSDVPHGEVTDFYRSVKAEQGEKIVFSWMEYPSKALRDEAGKKMMEDPRFEALGEMPFDGKRMIYSGFEILLQK
jgi:uncharacterized protein YbaA (DUF1428 family)